MAPGERAEKEIALAPHPDDATALGDASGDRLIDVDVEKHLRWLETGEGDPWPASHD